MTKGFEYGNIVPIASKRLRSAGSCERVSVHADRENVTPILRDGVMMSAENWQAYIQRKREAWKAEQRQKGLARAAWLRQRQSNVTGVTKGSE